MAGRFRLQWPVDSRTITQYFGENPQVYAPYNLPGHEGLDLQASIGRNVYACADGEVCDIRPDDGNPYGIHARIRHRVNGREYCTVYAHLSRVFVSTAQRVSAGERIALSGDSGHSFGPHLHLTLKLAGAQTPGYPAGVVDPLPYLVEAEPPQPSDLRIHPAERVRLRAGPTTASAELAWLERGEALTVLGDAQEARARVGKPEQWIQVQRADGLSGFVAAWYVQLQPLAPAPESVPEPAPAGPLTVYAVEPLNVRNGPSIGTSRIAIALPHEQLTVIGDRVASLAAVGDRGAWLQVLLPYGLKGYAAAWYVRTEPGPAPQSMLTVYPTEDMNMRERPAIGARLVTRLAQHTPLAVHDDPQRTRALVGRYDEWLYAQAVGGQWGWVAAWYVQLQPPSLTLSAPTLELAPAGPLTVYAAEPLNVRKGPSPETSRIAIALPHEPLSTMGERRTILSRLGRPGEWLRVRLPDGLKGYVAAQYVQHEPGPAPEPLLAVYPLRDTHMRQRPAVRTGRIGQATRGTALTVHDDPERARALVGRYDEWLYVEALGGQRGWVAAWCVATER